MKKKFLIGLILLLILPAAALGIFIATFNAELYRPLVIRTLEQSLGKPVKLERMSLGWSGGIALSLQNLAVDSQPPLRVDELRLVVRPLPLLRKELQVSSITARLADGTIRASGSVDASDSAQPQVRFHITAEDLAVEQLLPAQDPSEPALKGRLSGDFDGQFQGAGLEQVLQSLTGSGRIRLRQGLLVNLNLLRQAFQRISIIPGLVERLASRLPDSYRQKLETPHTALEPVDWALAVGGGGVRFENAQVSTDHFVLTGTGRVGFDWSLSARAVFRLHPDLSGAVGKSVEELVLLAGPDGAIQFPVLLEGRLPRVAVLPDLSYLASRLVTRSAQDLLGGLLEKVLEKERSE